jgi:Polyketide cyclase / dehydrase and lipid transport
MVRIDGEIVINRPVDAVFDFVADERNEPCYNPRMRRVEKLSPGPIGLGTRFHAEIRSRPRPAEMIIEWTGYDPPRRLGSWTQLSTMDIRGALTFDPIAEGTRMRWSWVVAPRGVFKLLTPLIAGTGRRQEQAIWANLKRVLEAEQAPSATAGR